MTNLREYKDHFVNELKLVYSVPEAESLFFIFLQEWTGMSKLEYLDRSRDKIYDKVRFQMDEVCRGLLKGKPFQHLLGYVSFALLQLEVNENALIPRPETEELAFMLKRDLYKRKPSSVLDIGCGTGCLALAAKKFFPEARVMALDYSGAALQLAARNAAQNRLEVDLVEADFLDERQRPQGFFELIVSNPPYIANAEKASMDKLVLEHDPHQALFVPDEDPLIFYRAIADYAINALTENGSVYVEINERLGEETCEEFRAAGFITELRKDMYGKDRFVVAARPRQPGNLSSINSLGFRPLRNSEFRLQALKE